MKPGLQRHVKQEASKLYRDGLHPKGRVFDLYQPVKVKHTWRGKEKWIPGTIVAVKGLKTCLVRGLGSDRLFVHDKHLIPDDTRGMGECAKGCTRCVKREFTLDLQEASLSPGAIWKIPYNDSSEIFHKSDIISVPTVDDNIELEGNDDSRCENPDTVITRPIEPSHSESKPGLVVTRLGKVIKPPNRLGFI